MTGRALAVVAGGLLAGIVLDALVWFLPLVLTVPLFLTHALHNASRVLLPLAAAAALLPGGSVAAGGAVLLPLAVRRFLGAREVDFSFSFSATLLLSVLAAEFILASPPVIRLWRSGMPLAAALQRAMPWVELGIIAAAVSGLVFIITILLHFNRRADV